MPKKLTIHEFITKSKEIHNDKYDYSLVEYKNNTTPVELRCNIHGNFKQKPVAHLAGKGCKKCGHLLIAAKNSYDNYDRNNSIHEFINKASILHSNKYDYSLMNFKNLNTKIKIICPTHGIFEQTPYNHLNNNGCNRCKYKFNSIIDFIEKSKKIHGDIYDYSRVDFIKTEDKIEIICPTHGVFKQTVSSHIRGFKCFKCTRLQKKNNIDYINECKAIHNNKYDYIQTKYNGCFKKVKIICPFHGVFEQRAGAHIKGHGCALCKESKGEILISNYLQERNITFSRQKTFKECINERLLPFDFYIESHNIIIEYDGKQHFEPVERFGGLDGFNKTRINDDIKNKYCEANMIKLIRISYKQDIFEILSKYF